jgi:hypothetical protein
MRKSIALLVSKTCAPIGEESSELYEFVPAQAEIRRSSVGQDEITTVARNSS